MHIPDGFLDAKTWISATILSTGAISYSVRKTRQELSERQVPRLGVMAAFIFAAQMINFPIAGGTSGHLMGAALATALLGPWSASIVLATVLMVQCFVFQDGGVTALGANILNMSVMGVGMSALIFRLSSSLMKGKLGLAVTTFIASWFSVMAAAALVVLELALAGTVPAALALPAMLGVHGLIGIGEGLITTVVVVAVSNMGFFPNWYSKGGICSE